ncbi:MAG: response regulator transcription factor [Acidobacteriota bacterium]
MKPCRILLADDHAVVLEGLRRILSQPGFEVVGSVGDGRALIEAAAALRPDVIITDVSMPSLNGVEAARIIRKQKRPPKIIFLTMRPEVVYAVEALRAGGSGYVLKSSAGDQLITAIREVLDGRVYVAPLIAEPVMVALRARGTNDHGLTARQRQVLQLIAEGRTPKEIGAVLNVSDRTVEFHKYRIMATLGLRTVAELVGYAVKRGIVA